MTRLPQTASLHILSSIQHLSAVRDFLEHAARSFGFGEGDCLRIGLAGEEIFSYVCSLDAAGGTVELGVQSHGYQLRVTFLFDAASFDPWAFNLGARVSLEDEASLEGLGLLLASRMTDGFAINLRQSGRIELLLLKDKSYPDEPVSGLWPPPQAETVLVREATPDDIRQFAARLRQAAPDGSHPPFLLSAPRLADMVASGDYRMMAVVADNGTVLGGVAWHERNERSIEIYGPYLVTAPAADCAGLLLEALLGQVAKQRALCLLSRWTPPELLAGEFELLGQISLRDDHGGELVQQMMYRQLKEDVGSRVWGVPEIETFLQGEYDRLFFAREMVVASRDSSPRPAHSVFAAVLERARRAVTLTAVLDGEDAESNLKRQLAVLAQENLPNVFFEIDLGFAWQAALIPVLLRNGFVPKLVMPYAGRADVVLFQKVFAA